MRSGVLSHLMISNRLIAVWVTLATAVGVFLILTTGARFTAIGVVLVIVGLMSLMPALYNRMSEEPAVDG